MATSTQLYHLKNWLTVEDAASHLSSLLSETVTRQDVLQLGLEGHLKLSVLFLAPAYARRGRIVSLMNTEVALVPPDNQSVFTFSPTGPLEEKAKQVYGCKLGKILSFHRELKEAIDEGCLRVVPLHPKISDDEFVEWYGDVFEIDGLWDLPLVAGERADVEDIYQEMIGGENLAIWNIEGAWVERDGGVYSLQEKRPVKALDPKVFEFTGSGEGRYGNPDNWIESERLPKESKVVVRRKNLDRFIASLEELGPTKNDEGEERRSLEVFGILVELYASQHGHDHWHGSRPNISCIAKDMLNYMPDDVTNMGYRKLQDVVSHALKAWEAKKRR